MDLVNHIYKHLLQGDLQVISSKTGFSRVTVFNHLTGKIKKVNPQIINTALDLVEERRKKGEEIDQRFKKVFPEVN